MEAPHDTPPGQRHHHDAAHRRAHADAWAQDLTVGYDSTPVLEHVSFEVEAGALLAIVGPNGAGKSTLLKVMAGLLRPWSGRVEVLGSLPGREARRIAYVPQAETVDWDFPVTVRDVVMMGRYPGLGPLRQPGPVDRRAVAEALEQVGMSGERATQIGALSGGQRRRVFLARALASGASVFLLDEPVTGIDLATEQELMDILETETKRGKTVLATTHDLAAAAERFERVLVINRTVIADGPSSLVLDPDVLSRAYGGHLLVLAGRALVLDDAHHHDQAPPGERHYHDDRKRP